MFRNNYIHLNNIKTTFKLDGSLCKVCERVLRNAVGSLFVIVVDCSEHPQDFHSKVDEGYNLPFNVDMTNQLKNKKKSQKQNVYCQYMLSNTKTKLACRGAVSKLLCETRLTVT